MKAAWKKLSARFAAMPKRDRMLLPGAICVAVLVLGHLLLIDPARKQHQLLKKKHTQESAALQAAQEQMNLLRGKVNDPDAALRAQLDNVRTQTSQADGQLKQLQASLVPAREMSQWLSSLLQSQRGLQLVNLRTLPVASVSDLMAAKVLGEPSSARPTAQAAGAHESIPALAASLAASGASLVAAPAPTMPASAAGGNTAREAWLFRHGVQITLRGSYHDLLAYLNTLEHMPRRVYWGELKVDAQDSPAVVMTLTVYTISLEKTWWVI